MKKNEVRDLVREVLSEIDMALGGGGWDSNNDVAQFHSSPNSQFPYLYTDKPEMLPSVGDLKNQYNDFDEFRKNNEVYEFPFEDFKKGLEKEVNTCKEEGKNLHLYDIARFVLDNLQKDKNFYSSIDVDNTERNNENQEEINDRG